MAGKRSETMQRAVCVAVMDQLAVVIKRSPFLGVMVFQFVNGKRNCYFVESFMTLFQGCTVRCLKKCTEGAVAQRIAVLL